MKGVSPWRKLVSHTVATIVILMLMGPKLRTWPCAKLCSKYIGHLVIEQLVKIPVLLSDHY